MSRHGFANKIDDRHNRNAIVWQEGYTAGLAGKQFKDCPYKSLLDYDRCQWIYGWTFGVHTKAKKEAEDWEDEL